MAGKPKAKINIDELERLARLHCTIEEAAAFFKCAKRTLLRYLDPKNKDASYREAWERGQHAGKLSLRRLQWRHASGNGSSAVQMTIHLSKHLLGQTEKSLVQVEGTEGLPVKTATAKRDLAELSSDEIKAQVAALQAAASALEDAGY